MKVAICDDEPVHRKRLAEIIQMNLDLSSIEYSISEFESGEDLILSSAAREGDSRAILF